ncbi:YibE/F family protein [Candidatus Poribacteria bacterium]|nr:YibE/F family protein [Candidatus Poribacteria bacterium]MBT5531510.1 YibE/F family protein [Candidatus Poribacteria bacterium]MBT5709449.1 YibE/F family protein [Candidatus Poribacteria bacterium]MBT7099578.1 YibE/F family protein [Candidatus Poribacteria bacterium]MBT7807929.1 YibE/F family protein [Candidatus Poribacteria bacterium]
MRFLVRWQTPIALVVVLVLTHAIYTRMQTHSATVIEQRNEAGDVVAMSEYVKGRILDVVRVVPEEETGNEAHILDIELLGGAFAGRRALFRNYVNPGGFPMLNVNATIGDIVLCRVGGSGDILNARNLVQDYNRDGFIIALLGILFAVMIVIGRATGIRSVITMVVNGLILYFVMLPLIHKGYDPVWTVVLTCALISVQSRLIVAGPGRKTYAAILGTVGGVVIAGFIVIYAQQQLHFTGVEKANAVDLVESRSADYIDFAGLLLAGMLIGLLGVANDAAIEVASAMEEVNEANPDLSIPRLMTSGMNVGTDILGTMTNTVVFLYFGMRLLIVLTVAGTAIFPFTTMQLFSLGVVAAEIVRVVAGTLGLVITIPLTAGISALLHLQARRRKAVYA